MHIFQFLQQNEWAFLLVTGLLGLLIGSFLNVVIYRLPIMMQREWEGECREMLGQEQPGESSEPFNLNRPRSRCPHCGHAISALENIPLISYLVLKGRCSGCQARISQRYPMVELTTALLSLVVAICFGFGWPAFAAILLTWVLITLSLIDFDVQLLPDNITLPTLWFGLLLNLNGLFTDIESAVIGAAAGYLSLWSVYQLFKLLTGKEGMGYGDFKLLALFGAWFGWQYLPQIILISAVVGAVIGVGLILLRGRDRNIPIPFGPYLAIAGWIAMLWGDVINHTYLQWSGLA
jgi:leader peptidase (prepilin peptidase)/N-methyltransferase